MKNVGGYVVSFLLGLAICWGIGKMSKSKTSGDAGDNIGADSLNHQSAGAIDAKAIDDIYAKMTRPINRLKADTLLSNYLHWVGDTDSTKDPMETSYFALSLFQMEQIIHVFRHKLSADGIRIYPGKYPKSEPTHYLPNIGEADLSSKLTIFFVPTKDSTYPDGKIWPQDILKHPAMTVQFIENETTQCPPPKCPKFGATLMKELYGGNNLLRIPKP